MSSGEDLEVPLHIPCGTSLGQAGLRAAIRPSRDTGQGLRLPIRSSGNEGWRTPKVLTGGPKSLRR